MPPVVIFSLNGPKRLRPVLDALKPQGIERLIILAADPCRGMDAKQVEGYENTSLSVDWTDCELRLRQENSIDPDLTYDISELLSLCQSAIFLDDNCLPMPGFYSFMKRALKHYERNKRVFSISAYQPIDYQDLRHHASSLVSSARFPGLGWATWQDRWLNVLPYLSKCWELYPKAHYVPPTAGPDLAEIQRLGLRQLGLSWEWSIAITTLWLGKVHLLPTRGLIRRFANGLRPSPSSHLSNNNVSDALVDQIDWLENVEPTASYIEILSESVAKATAKQQTPTNSGSRGKVRSLYRIGRGRLGRLKRAIAPPPQSAPPLRYFKSVLENGSHLKKRALVSYITDRFGVERSDPRFFEHILIWHSQEIVRVLNRLGYCVDVVSYDDRTFTPQDRYDLFVGHMGINFTQIASALPSDTPKIYFSTTNYWNFHNKQELIRLSALKERRGVDMRLAWDRFLAFPEDEALARADAIVGLGNAFTRKTYGDFSRVITINNTALTDNHFDTQNKDYDQGRSHFLFFAGPGNVHKGLDLLLEAFDMTPECHLWICTQIEEHFHAAYEDLLRNRSNIHLLGWIQPRSSTYYDLINRCNFMILPSCSEGGVHSVVEGMNHGLIPLITRECALDVGGFGMYIDPCEIREIVEVVKKALAYSPDLCRLMSQNARREASTKYSESAFSQNFQTALETILQQNLKEADTPAPIKVHELSNTR